jgi:hypothetical protein
MSTIEDESLSDETRKRLEKLGYFDKSDDELLKREAENEKKFRSFAKEFPGSNGCERAFLKANGEIVVEFSESGDGSHSVGSRTYSPDHDLYKPMMLRHHLAERAQGQMHFVAQKYDDETKQWSDLGDGWFD